MKKIIILAMIFGILWFSPVGQVQAGPGHDLSVHIIDTSGGTAWFVNLYDDNDTLLFSKPAMVGVGEFLSLPNTAYYLGFATELEGPSPYHWPVSLSGGSTTKYFYAIRGTVSGTGTWYARLYLQPDDLDSVDTASLHNKAYSLSPVPGGTTYHIGLTATNAPGDQPPFKEDVAVASAEITNLNFYQISGAASGSGPWYAQLLDQSNSKKETRSVTGGVFSFTPVVPGTYNVGITSTSNANPVVTKQVVVGAAEVGGVDFYTLSGTVDQGQGLYAYLYKGGIQKSKQLIASNGSYLFPFELPDGSYEIGIGTSSTAPAAAQQWSVVINGGDQTKNFYRISGTVQDSKSGKAWYVYLFRSDQTDQAEKKAIGQNGDYEFTTLVPDGEYEVGIGFINTAPTQKWPVKIEGANQTQNFYAISGSESASGTWYACLYPSGVTPLETQTVQNGSFAFTPVPAGTYRVGVTASAGGTPDITKDVVLTDAEVIDADFYQLKGMVSGGSGWYTYLYKPDDFVQIGLKKAVNPDGSFGFTSMLPKGSYRVGIGTNTTAPAQTLLWPAAINDGDVSKHFYQISGTVSGEETWYARLYASGNPAQFMEQKQVASKAYAFTPVPAGDYQVGVVTTPDTHPTYYLNLPGVSNPVGDANFYKLTAIVSSGTGISGVPLTLTWGSNGTSQAQTDADGQFIFNGLPGKASYTLNAAITGGTGSPNQDQSVNLDIDRLVEFKISYSITGSVKNARTSLGVSGVTLKLSGGPSAKDDILSDGEGKYTFSGLNMGPYTVTAELRGGRIQDNPKQVTVGPTYNDNELIFTIGWQVNVPLLVKPDPLLLYQSNFSTGVSGWTGYSTDGVGQAGVDGGQGMYYLTSPAASKVVYAVAPVAAGAFSAKGYNVQARVRLNETSDSKIGLLFDWVSVNEYSVAMIRPKTGYCQIYHYKGSYTTLASVANCPMNAGALANTLKVVREGSEARLYVNDLQVAKATATGYGFSTGQAGLVFMAYTDAPVKGWFDELEIRNLP